MVDQSRPTIGQGSRIDDRPLVIAHRGASRVHPGNTLAAFVGAIAAGADMVEFDVRRTLDGAFVVYHNQLYRGIPFGRWRSDELTELRTAQRRRRLVGGVPPLLEDVLETCQGRIKLNMEIKEPGYESTLLDATVQWVDVDDLIVTSFRDEAVAAVKRHNADVVTGLLLDHPGRPGMFERVSRCSADLVAPHDMLLTKRLAAQAAERGIGIVAWTVNREARLTRLLSDTRMTGIVTDVPDVAVAIQQSLRDL